MSTSTITKNVLPSELTAATPLFHIYSHSGTYSLNSSGTHAVISIDVSRPGEWIPLGVVGINTQNSEVVPIVSRIIPDANLANKYWLYIKFKHVNNSSVSETSFYADILYVSNNITVYRA